jgi:Holliday junction resolvase-like predicted endonuclease
VWSRQLTENDDIKFGKDQDAETCLHQGMAMISEYIRQLDPQERVVSVNEAFAVALVDAAGNVLNKPMIGEFDLIVDHDGIIVCDEKSAARRWPKGQADKSLQPTAYLYAYQQIHGLEVPFRFQVAVKNKKPVIDHHLTDRTQDQFQRMIELIKAIDSMIAAEHFLPNEGSFYCSGCTHQAACEKWHRQRTTVNLQMAA